jgi:hypothetical protein
MALMEASSRACTIGPFRYPFSDSYGWGWSVTSHMYIEGLA